jgi:hypothetical protein
MAHLYFNLVLLFDIKMGLESVLKNPLFLQVRKSPLRSGTRSRTAPDHHRRRGGARTPQKRGRGEGRGTRKIE